ncbi:MAG TPA: response regulator transcription factor [Sphingomicrobium sp.]|nr:response regulator transcription factor [Sphingomicrobium sp.]
MVATGSVAVVAERQSFYNAGLAAMLQHDVGFSRVVRAENYAELMKILALHSQVDFLALDFGLPGTAGLETIRKLREDHPAMRLAVFSERMELHEVLTILAAGAQGFIPRQIGNCSELLKALRTVQDSGIFVPPDLLGSPANGHDHSDEDLDCEPLAQLTERQQQVIRLLSEGHANKVIARRLGISPSTVKVHVHAAFRTLGVHSRLAALAAIRPAARVSSMEA